MTFTQIISLLEYAKVKLHEGWNFDLDGSKLRVWYTGNYREQTFSTFEEVLAWLQS